MTGDSIASIIATVVPTVGLVGGLIAFLWRQRESWAKKRESALRRGEVSAWANEVIAALESLLLLTMLKEAQLSAIAAKSKLTEVIFNTAILVERGRMFFKNAVVDDFGKEKEPAYQGYRPKILDPIVIAYRVAYAWNDADEEKRLRVRCVAEDCLKKFVSLVQKEVGRDRAASADIGKGGDGSSLQLLLDSVDVRRLELLRRAALPDFMAQEST